MYTAFAKILIGVAAITAVFILSNVGDALELFFMVCGIPLTLLAGAGLMAQGTVDLYNQIPKRIMNDTIQRVERWAEDKKKSVTAEASA